MKKAAGWVLGISLPVLLVTMFALTLSVFDRNYDVIKPICMVMITAWILTALSILYLRFGEKPKCPHCGRMAEGQGPFCTYCGKSLE